MTASAYNIPPHKRDITDMRAEAQAFDLRNRIIPVETVPFFNIPTCRIIACESILTISDFAGVCRQCRMMGER